MSKKATALLVALVIFMSPYSGAEQVVTETKTNEITTGRTLSTKDFRLFIHTPYTAGVNAIKTTKTASVFLETASTIDNKEIIEKIVPVDDTEAQVANEEIQEAVYYTEASYTEEDLYWLSRVIDAEAGSSWIPDWVQQAVGSVVLNRSSSSRYADGIKNVVFQKGQYHCVTNGSIYKEPSEKSVKNAKYILENGSILPKGVLGQSEFVQGEIHSEYYDSYLGSTTYFCYM